MHRQKREFAEELVVSFEVLKSAVTRLRPVPVDLRTTGNQVLARWSILAV